MFKMTSDIRVVGVGKFKPSSIAWERSIYNYCDTAVVKIPHTARDKDEKITQTATYFKLGMPIEIFAGYDGKNDLQFKGFISKIVNKVPVEIQCEGYHYQLRKVTNINKAYSKVSIGKIFEDLFHGKGIKIHPQCYNVSLDSIRFKEKNGVEVLDELKKAGLTVYFIYDTLYVGGQMLAPSKTQILKLNWNTISHDLVTTGQIEDVVVNIEYRDKDGSKRKFTVGKSGNADARTVSIKTFIKDSTLLNDIATQKQKEEIARSGKITTFLKPFIEPGMSVKVISEKHEEVNGSFFCSGVKGSFSVSGGRQEINVSRI